MKLRLEDVYQTVRFHQYKHKCRRKIHKFNKFDWVKKDLPGLPDGFEKKCSEFCASSLKGLGLPEWGMGYAAVNGIHQPNYIPEDFFYLYFEPAINNYELSNAYTNKAMLDRFFPEAAKPHTYVYSANGYFYGPGFKPISSENVHGMVHELLASEGKLIYKEAVNSRGGKSVKLLTPETQGLTKLLDSNDYVIQKYIIQHEDMAVFNPKSLNTVRVMTFRYPDATTVKPVSHVVRMGRSHMFVDNQSSGGISVGVKADGSLRNRAFDGFFLRFDEKHPDHDVIFKEQKIPFFNEIISLCQDLHVQMPYFRLISWDIAVLPDGSLILVEFNTRFEEINFHQLNNGPLFGDDTEEILSDFFTRYPIS